MKTTETTQPTPRSNSPAPAWTPGPWTAERCHNKETGRRQWLVLCENATRHVATVTRDEDCEGINDKETARLIAAAPEMAEALRDLLALTEALRDHVKHNLNGADLLAPASPRIAKARALLARINGHNPP